MKLQLFGNDYKQWNPITNEIAIKYSKKRI